MRALPRLPKRPKSLWGMYHSMTEVSAIRPDFPSPSAATQKVLRAPMQESGFIIGQSLSHFSVKKTIDANMPVTCYYFRKSCN